MSNQFPPSVVLELIMSNLEKTDLLNNRLVCQDWNKECLKFFKKSSKFEFTLDHKNSDDYLKFLSSSTSKPTSKSVILENQQQQQIIQLQPVMPIHFKFNLIDLSEDYYDSDGKELSIQRTIDIENRRLQEFVATVKTLQNLSGSESVRSLTFIYPEPHHESDFLDKLAKILGDLSPGLQKLVIGLDSTIYDNEDWIVLPKVKHLSFNWRKEISRHLSVVVDAGSKTCLKLIQACPNLETLVIGTMSEDDTKHWPTSLPFPPVGVKSLEFTSIPVDWLLRKFQEHPSLATLKNLEACDLRLFNDNNFKDSGKYKEILRLVSPSLSSLSMPWTVPPRRRRSRENYDYDEDDHWWEIPFPTFPALKTLAIMKVSRDSLSQFKIDPEAFPALESVDIPFFATLILLQGFELQFQNPSVKTLTLGFSFTGKYDPIDEDKMWNNTAQFRKVFPNVTKIGFRNNNNENQGFEHGEMIKLHLKRFLNQNRSFFSKQFSGVSKIQELELIDFNQNYLGEVLDQIQHPPRLVLENVTRNSLVDDKLIKTHRNLFHDPGGFGLKPAALKISEEEVSFDIEGGRRCRRIVVVKQTHEPLDNRLINVRKIRLVLTEKSRDQFIQELKKRGADSEHGDVMDMPKKLYLTAMMANFPHLEEIEVSSIMFAHNAVDRAERIQRIKEKFPGLVINII